MANESGFTQKALKQINGCLTGAYTCLACNKPSVAAVFTWKEYSPACAKHGKEAEQRGHTVIWELPKEGGNE